MSRALTGFILLLAALVSACSDAPTTSPPTDAAAISEARMGTNPPGQVREIEALKRAWDAAWGDAAALAATYTEDAEFINPVGGPILASREEIRATFAFLFQGPFAGSTQTSELRRLVFLTGSIAMVDLDITLSGYRGLPPGLRETAPGVVLARVKWVAVKHRGEWLILAQQMTPLPPLP